jgi:threonine synthase
VLCVPEDAPAAKLTQIRVYGARPLRVRGMVGSPAALRTVFDRLRAITAARGMPLGVSAYACSPQAMAGIESLGRELLAAFDTPPDRVFVPVGGGGLLVATARGLRAGGGEGAPAEDRDAGHNGQATHGQGAQGARGGSPEPEPGAATKVHAVQAEGNDTLVGALHAGETHAREVTTSARISGLAVPLDLDATAAMNAVRASGGDAHLVDDALVWEVQAHLARHEGLYVEPAGAVSVAGVWRAAEQGQIGTGERVVCVLTGHGFKDAAAAQRMAERESAAGLVVSPVDIDQVLLDRLLADR